MGDWDYDVEEVVEEDGVSVGSLVVRFSTPDGVTSASDLELLLEPGDSVAESDTIGCALAIKSADGKELCRVPLSFKVEEGGLKARFRKKLRTLSVTVPVIRDLRPHLLLSLPDPRGHKITRSSLAFSLEDDGCSTSANCNADYDPDVRGHEAGEGVVVGGKLMRQGLDNTHIASHSCRAVESKAGIIFTPAIEAEPDEARWAIALEDKSRAMALELKENGNNFVKKSKYAQALMLYRQSIKVWPSDPAVYTNSALCHMRTGDLDAAIADCRACIVIDATFVRAHERLGAIFEEQSNFSAALMAYEAGLEVDRSNVRCAAGRISAAKALEEQEKTSTCQGKESEAFRTMPRTPITRTTCTTFPATPSTNTCVNAPTNTTDKPSQSTRATSGSKGSSRSSSRRGGAGPVEPSATLQPLPPATTHASSTSGTSRSGGAGSGLGEEGMCAGEEGICTTLTALGLQLKTVPGRGRCVWAARTRDSGQVVLEASPMACVVHDKYTDEVCHFCFEPLRHCSRSCNVKCICASVVYCKRECAEADVAHAGHECRRLALWREQGSSVQRSTRGLRLFLRLLYSNARGRCAVFERDMRHVKTQRYAMDKEMARLASLLAAAPGAQDDASNLAMANAVNRFAEEEVRMDVGRLAKLISQARLNTHAVQDWEGHQLGHGLYPLASFFNHSCRPNAVVSFKGQKLVVRALRRIAAGEEVTIAYVELYQPTPYRRLQLKNKKGFDCDCDRCISPLPATLALESNISAGPPHLAAEARTGWDRGLEQFHRHEYTSSLETLRAVLNKVAGELGPEHWVVYDIYKLLVDVCLALQEWDKVELYARMSLKAMEAGHLPKYHPNIALMSYHLGTALLKQHHSLHQSLGQSSISSPSAGGGGGDGGVVSSTCGERREGESVLKEALRYYIKACSVLSVSYGKDHWCTLEMIRNKEMVEEMRRGSGRRAS